MGYLIRGVTLFAHRGEEYQLIHANEALGMEVDEPADVEEFLLQDSQLHTLLEHQP
jgi:hypothetical protein